MDDAEPGDSKATFPRDLSETKVVDEFPIAESTNTPVWMKAQLRPVSATPFAKSDVFIEPFSSADSEPEWMKKFKQMGLEKNE
jgi:hypothetical protein